MSVQLYNTLTRRKEDFVPIEPGQVRMYCCGVTVYDHCHLGHARSYIVWDTLRRYLIWRGWTVRYVQNFTDIDDKILHRARQQGVSMRAVSDRYTAAYFEDMARLNIQPADAYPRATDTLDGIQRLIHELEAGGHAYASAGDVYFSVRSFPGYGKLSGRKLEDLQAGAGGRTDDEEAARKKDVADFALWKGAKPEEPAWESPWGPGRPGWHIECSAMVRAEFAPLGSIDIHMGGGDLIFPHHENEIAQSEAATGQPLAHYWLHNGMVRVGGEKMSKSLGNFTTIRALLDDPKGPAPMAVRLFVLQGHYRKPMDFTPEAIAAAGNSWATLREGLTFGEAKTDEQAGELAIDPAIESSLAAPYRDRFIAALDDDLNSPEALAVLFELAKELRKEKNVRLHTGHTASDPARLQALWRLLVELAAVLGLVAEPLASAPAPVGLGDEEIAAAIAERQAARAAKNFAEADRLRDTLKAQGITLIDQPDGQTLWQRET